MSSQTLMHCPFCHAQPIPAESEAEPGLHNVHCVNAHCPAYPLTIIAPTPQRAATIWNGKAKDIPYEQVIFP